MLFQRLTTAELPARDRLDRWIEFGPEGSGKFEASLTRATVGRLGFVWMETTAATATSRSPSAGAWASPTGEAYLLRVQDYGQTIIGSGDNATALRPQEMVLRSCSGKWSTRVPHRTGLVTIKVPIHVLTSRIGDPDRVEGRAFSGTSGPGKVAASAIAAVKQLLIEGEQDSWSDAVEDILLSALALACASPSCEASGEFPLSIARERAWRQACQYIDDSLGDPELSVCNVACATGINLRTLQRLFVTMGESPREYILRRRLDRAREIIRSGQHQCAMRITDVAFQVGFNDLSHFSRAFARRFGQPPSKLSRDQ
jgi:AraC-like DNA-binding protein